jgi:hypothetical protein
MANGYNSARLTELELVELVELWQTVHGLEVDGLAGPETLKSISDVIAEDFSGPLGQLPRSRAELIQKLGHPGSVKEPDENWIAENILDLRDLPGVDRWVKIHRLVEPYLREGLRRASIASSYKIQRCGGFVHRHLRHQWWRALSLHCWAAVDINPADNKARSFRRGRAPVPWSPEWMRIWPKGVDREFVEAMESAGWTWGGAWGARCGDIADRAKKARRLDPMHFEIRDR